MNKTEPNCKRDILIVVAVVAVAALVALALGHNRAFGSRYKLVQLPAPAPAAEDQGAAGRNAETQRPQFGVSLVKIGPAEKRFLLETINKAFSSLKTKQRLPELSELGKIPEACQEDGAWGFFLTLYAPAKRPLRVVVQEKTLLLSALVAAENTFKQPAYRIRRFDRDHRVKLKIDILRDVKPLDVKERPVFSTEPITSVIGLQIIKGGKISYTLPSDLIRYNVSTQMDLLRLAASRAGLQPFSWRDHDCKVNILTTTSWVSREPGSSDYYDIVRAFPLVTEVTEQKLLGCCVYGGRYLATSQYQSGQFTYNYIASSDQPDNDNYNIVRHAGVCWALYKLYGMTKRLGFANDEYRDAADRGMDYLLNFIQLDKRKGWMFVSEGRNVGEDVNIGATALAAIALLERRRQIPGDNRYDKQVVLLMLRFLRSMQTESGRFNCSYDFKMDKRFTDPSLGAALLYYPGETTLALVMGAKILGDPDCLEAARRSLDYLTQKRDLTLDPNVDTVPPHDHWAVNAIEEMADIDPRRRDAIYAYKVARSMGRFQFTEKTAPSPDYVGGKRAVIPPSVCATATDLEAYTGAWLALRRWTKDDPDMRAKQQECLVWAKRAACFVLSNQFVPENSYFIPNPTRALGGVHASPTTSFVRNDYVQHTLCAMIKMSAVLKLAAAEQENKKDGP